jgi:hypothetical protein
MGDPGQIVSVIVVLTITAVGSYAAISLVQALARRFGSGKSPDALQAELDELRARVEEGEQARYRIAELEERLDFAERMLAQQREPGRLGSAGDRP